MVLVLPQHLEKIIAQIAKGESSEHDLQRFRFRVLAMVVA